MDFECYVAEKRRALFRFAAVIANDPHLAEEIVSETLARLYPQWSRIAALKDPHAYVRKGVLNEYLSWRRRSRRLSTRAEVEERMPPSPNHADSVTDRQQLEGELRRLPAKQRAAVVLRYFEGLSFAEIAETLGSSENAVRSNLSRGLRRLRIQMTDHPSGDAIAGASRTLPCDNRGDT